MKIFGEVNTSENSLTGKDEEEYQLWRVDDTHMKVAAEMDQQRGRGLN